MNTTKLVPTNNNAFAVCVNDEDTSLVLEPIYGWVWDAEGGRYIGYCADEAGLFPCTDLSGYVGVVASKEEAIRKFSVCARKATDVVSVIL